MPSTIDSAATVKYNGVTFPTSSRVKVRGTPIYDSSGRTVKYTRYHVSVDCIFAQDEFPQSITSAYGLPRGLVELTESTGRIDEGFEDIRKLLTEPGRKLTLTWTAAGRDFEITTEMCVDFGPKPSLDLAEPIATTRAIHVAWSCDATVCDYYDNPATGVREIGQGPNPWGEWNYSIDYSFTPDGLTIKTITGVVEARVYKNGPGDSHEDGEWINNTAESFLDTLVFPLHDRFSRSQNYHISQDKRFLNYVITDTEIASDNPYYPGCLRMDVNYRVSGGLMFGPNFSDMKAANGGRWKVSLNGSISVAPGEPRSTAWMAFKTILASRLEAVRYATQVNGKPGFILVPIDIDLEEEIFGRTIHFNTSWVLCSSLATLLAGSGMWAPIPGDWNTWKTNASIQAVHSTRGVRNAVHPASVDVICNFNHGTPRFTAEETLAGKDEEDYGEPIFQCPSEEYSFLAYDSYTQIEQAGGVIAPVKLGGYATGAPTLSPNEMSAPIDYGTSQSEEPDKAIVQKRTVGKWTLSFEGFIVRVGYPITEEDLPTVTTVGGLPAIRQAGSWSFPSPAQDLLGDCPVYTMTWRHLYLVETPNKADIVIENEPITYPIVGLPQPEE